MLGRKHGGVAFLCMLCSIRKANISTLRRGTSRLEAKIEMVYNSQKTILSRQTLFIGKE